MAMRLESLIITMLLWITAGGKSFYSQKRTVPNPSYTAHQRSRPPGELDTPYLEANSSLKDGDYLISENGNFTLGFFSGETSAYLGIWYTSSDDDDDVTPYLEVFWFANLDAPIPSKVLVNCSLALGEDGNAMVMDSSKGRIYWSTDSSSNHSKNGTYLIILDNGKLVLTDQKKYEEGTSSTLWQSSDNLDDECGSNKGCGSNGVCDADVGDGFRCKCLPGHHPVHPDKWSLGDDFSSGCSKNDQWGHQKHSFVWMKLVIASASLLILSCGIFVLVHFKRWATSKTGTIDQYNTDDIEDIDIPFIEYQSILAATNNFSDANKLGVGGFGPVYKGVLVDGNEVAVKRLSKASMQGVEEFKNEIVLIAKLQHRNLVRVIGYCISKGEKLLIYEYMPNKSLDSFLFNQTTQPLLDWMKRFDIILGIARGLLYLHQDSRLRIIHRDLKPANILLDEELNPKISDFGLAKIIAGNDKPTNTTRVVGTYGYISPEYALEGCFSIKSDVYSFGIIVFEIISGRRCTSLQPFDNAIISLLGYAWALWMQGKELELAHKSITSTCNNLEVKLCITVALLCTQEDPGERPTMSDVLVMLSGDNMNLPYPKQPVFIARRQPSLFSAGSNAELTITIGAR